MTGWAVQGIWPANAYNSSDVNAVDRDPHCKYLASSEDSGEVHIYRYPAVTAGAQSVTLKGHSSHVTNVRWSKAASPRAAAAGAIGGGRDRDRGSGVYGNLVSVGGNDKCVFVWDVYEK